ncbi:tripartite motif-containing protein 2-like [Ptychodera flava]|uniref:tripartite motif-containing protein 2-like n=1 Tax=Ptychodera flava TaxID=63121 RepID=UPI00396AAA6F
MAAAASSVGKVLDQIGEDFLSCVICFERYTNPKVLPCLHTYCEQCLLTLVEKQGVLNCPTCKTSCPLPHGGVQALKSNFFIAGLIEDFQARAKGDEKPAAKCDSCQESDAVMRCVECAQHLCQPCVKIHKNIAVTRSHQVLPIGEFAESKSTYTPNMTNKAVYCDVHPDKEVRFYCDTCQVPVCSDCTIVNHRIPQHVHRDLNTAADEYLGYLERMLSQLELKEHKAQKSKAASMEARTVLQKKDEEAGKQLSLRLQKAMQQLTYDEKRLTAELKKLYDLQMKAINISEIEKELESISVTSNYLKNLMSHENAAQVLSTKPVIDRHITKLLSSKSAPPFQPNIVSFRPCEEDVQGKVGQLISKVSYSNSTVENIPKQLLKGEVFDLLITTRDSRGKQATTSGKINVTVIKPDGSIEDMKVHDNKDGTYRITSRTEMHGNYTIIATVDDEPIMGTPVEIPVIKGFVKVFGGRGSQKGKFLNPLGVSINKDGDMVTADHGNNRLQVLDTDGNCKKVIEYTHFKNSFKPTDVAVSDVNHLYYSLDDGNNQVVVSDMDGNLIDIFGQGKLTTPKYIAIHPLTMDVYVADPVRLSEKIKIFANDGSYIKSFQMKGMLSILSSIAIRSSGIVLAVDCNTLFGGYIQMFEEGGKYLSRFGTTSATGDRRMDDRGITVYNEYVYVCDNDSIIKYDLHGNLLATIGIREGLKYPASLAVIGGEPLKIVVVDMENCCLKIL